MTPLHADAAAIVSTVAGSTSHRAAEVAAFLAEVLQARAGRGEAGKRSAAMRSARLRRGIRQAAGIEPLADGSKLLALPLQWAGWPDAVADRIAKAPGRFGLHSAPCDDVIRDEWAALKIVASSVP